MVKRLPSAILLLVLSLVLACSGKYDLDLTFSADDRLHGTIVVAVSRATAADGGTIDYDEATRDLPVASAEPYEDAAFVGRRIKLGEMTIPEFNAVLGRCLGD